MKPMAYQPAGNDGRRPWIDVTLCFLTCLCPSLTSGCRNEPDDCESYFLLTDLSLPPHPRR